MNAKFIEDVEYSGSTKLRNVVFEEEYVTISTLAIDNEQVIAPVIMQDANIDNQDALEISIAYNEELTPTHVVEQQQPQLDMPLRRPTISNDYIMYLQEHEFDIGLEGNPISFG